MIVLLTAFLAVPVNAQMMLCKKRPQLLTQLFASHQEAPVAVGLAANGSLFEVLTSADDGHTWTLIITQPNGISCVLATGESWQVLDAVKKKGAPS